MKNIFENGISQNITDVLKNRDHRVVVQQALLTNAPTKVVLAAKLNIPGPVKNNAFIKCFFENQLKHFEKQMLIGHLTFVKKEEWLDALTGPERFYLVDGDFKKLKQCAVSFEDSTPSRRLFDLDVLINDADNIRSISRTELGENPRKCLICNLPAKECGRSRRHQVSDLQIKVNQLILNANHQERLMEISNQLADIGVEALISEASAWPKPGLVDPIEHGAHPDMDYFLFVKSSISMRPYLKECALAGLNFDDHFPLSELFNEIREFGKFAEREMLKATAGINTHKGAIFSLGIVTAAVGFNLQHHQLNNENLQHTIREMLVNLINEDLKNKRNDGQSQTAGIQQYQKYGLGGVRSEAAAGYPVVFDHGLPAFNTYQDLNFNDRLVMTLMVIARYTTDSTLIKRASSPEIITWKNQQLDEFFAEGGISEKKGREFILKLQATFSENKLSLGGCADLLIITVFIAKVKGRFQKWNLQLMTEFN